MPTTEIDPSSLPKLTAEERRWAEMTTVCIVTDGREISEAEYAAIYAEFVRRGRKTLSQRQVNAILRAAR